ncbi:class I SAM-dependent methyltransferase [Sinosporangium siamense]|uniref:SAM-dependent methyltransferase n=1 Tax=Sinosporangium siamense TaxID=1367973 RepID=A0A919RBX4_9ACTN|nr:class I SAM-dependent methyltransferase [Sinosporangium siamense]GII91101.1 SAM-dependent methyltransferase [Sinosporangium siamense]
MGDMPVPFRADLARSIRLFRAFRTEQGDQDGYYSVLAADTTAQLTRYTPLLGRTVVDVGGGPGYFTRAFAREGARCVRLDADAGELTGRQPPEPGSAPPLGQGSAPTLGLDGAPPLGQGSAPTLGRDSAPPPEPGGVLGSALNLPLRDESVDICFSSNVLEHVRDPWRMAREMVRVTKAGGVVYLAFTNWLSPWGGHETSPWHYLGGERAARRYERKTGRPPKNRYGTSLYPVSVSAALRWAEHEPRVTVLDAVPRYLPAWTRPVLRLPGVREVVTWNLLLVLRRC